MSLVRMALRLTAVEAIRGRTLVGDNVKDSPAGAIESQADGTLRTDEERPFINIYTRYSKTKDAELRDLRRNGEVEFIVEFGIAAMLTETNDKGETSIVGIGIPANDEGFEQYLDAIEYQVACALTDPENAWAALWQKLSDGIVEIECRGAANERGGTQFAARELRIVLKAKPDPLLSAPLAPTSVWSLLRAELVTARPDVSDLFAALLGEPGAITPQLIQRSRGHTAGEAKALGYAPRFAGAPGAVIRGFTIEGGHVVSS